MDRHWRGPVGGADIAVHIGDSWGTALDLPSVPSHLILDKLGKGGSFAAVLQGACGAAMNLRAKPALECGSSSYRLPPSVHTAQAQGAEEERR